MPFNLNFPFKPTGDQSLAIEKDASINEEIDKLRHQAVQDQARKKALVEYGFRLPSALDNFLVDQGVRSQWLQP